VMNASNAANTCARIVSFSMNSSCRAAGTITRRCAAMIRWAGRDRRRGRIASYRDFDAAGKSSCPLRHRPHRSSDRRTEARFDAERDA
jgi:hypothetical protein